MFLPEGRPLVRWISRLRISPNKLSINDLINTEVVTQLGRLGRYSIMLSFACSRNDTERVVAAAITAEELKDSRNAARQRFQKLLDLISAAFGSGTVVYPDQHVGDHSNRGCTNMVHDEQYTMRSR